MAVWPTLLAFQISTAAATDPASVVRTFLDATAALDVDRMHAALADEYRLFDGGSSRLHNRQLTPVIVEWERGMHARWTYRILSVRGDTVTALLEEESEYFTLLGLERGVQVRSYVVRGGKIHESHGHLFVTARSSQAEALGAFKAWLRATVPQPDTTLIGPGGGLRLTKESVQPMLYWMRRWRAATDSQERSRAPIEHPPASHDDRQAVPPTRLHR